MYEVATYEQVFHSEDIHNQHMNLYHQQIYCAFQCEDINLTFPDESYDEEVAQLNHHNRKWHNNLLMRNTLNYVEHPIKYQKISLEYIRYPKGL